MAKRSVSRRKTPPKAPAKKPAVKPLPAEIRRIREQLFDVAALIFVARETIPRFDCGIAETHLTDTLRIAARIVDSATDALEPFQEGSHHD